MAACTSMARFYDASARHRDIKIVCLHGTSSITQRRAKLTRVGGSRTLARSMPTSIARARLSALLAAAPGVRIVVIGDAMLDVYLRGEVERISPEAPVPVVRVRERALALGGAANVAQNVAALGAECELVAGIGADSAGDTIRDLLARLGTERRSLVSLAAPRRPRRALWRELNRSCGSMKRTTPTSAVRKSTSSWLQSSVR